MLRKFVTVVLEVQINNTKEINKSKIGGILVVKFRPFEDGWVVYNTDNKALHTHTPHKRIAIKICKLVNKKEVPTSNDKRLVESCLRVTHNPEYRRRLLRYLESGEDKC